MILMAIIFLLVVILCTLVFLALKKKEYDKILTGHSQKISDLRRIQGQLIADQEVLRSEAIGLKSSYQKLNASHSALVKKLERAEDDGR